jgi:putative endonuclease
LILGVSVNGRPRVSIEPLASSSIQNHHLFMYYVYVLTNPGKIKHYIGYTSDLKRRVREHKSLKSYWSKRLVSPVLHYYEAYTTKKQAREREKRLKERGSSKAGLLKRIGLK